MLRIELEYACGSLAMYPAASVSGWYFAHPDSKYFGVERVTMDESRYCNTKGISEEESLRWLQANKAE